MNNYKEILEKIEPCDVILTCRKGFDIMSLPIKMGNYFKKGPLHYTERVWTHVAVYIGDGQIIEAFPQGIIKRDLQSAYFNADCGFKILRYKNINKDKVNKALEFYKTTTGKKYDLWALMYFIVANFMPPQLSFFLDNKYFGKIFNVTDSYFCSELVSEGFKKAGMYCFEREPYQVMPIEFDNKLLFDNVHSLDLPRKENKILYNIKAILFNIFYILAAAGAMLIILVLAIVGVSTLIEKIKKKEKN